MNRTSINLLSSIFLIFLAAAVVVPGIGMYMGVVDGFKSEGLHAQNHSVDSQDMGWPVLVTINTPNSEITALQKDIEADNGNVIHTHLRTAEYRLPAQAMGTGAKVISVTSALVFVICFCLMAFKTLRFVIAINRKHVFERSNIKRLNWIGKMLLGMAIAQIAVGIIEDNAVARLGLEVAGYGLTSFWTIPWTEFLLGLMSLLMAQIWQRGCQLHEEQQLTI